MGQPALVSMQTEKNARIKNGRSPFKDKGKMSSFPLANCLSAAHFKFDSCFFADNSRVGTLVDKPYSLNPILP